MLKNNFYTVISQNLQEESISATITITPGHEIFKGHFPGKPVVPGVCMIQIVKELMEQQSGQLLIFQKGTQIKFLQLLMPQQDVLIEINVRWETTAEGMRTAADFKKDANVIFKLSGMFVAQRHAQTA